MYLGVCEGVIVRKHTFLCWWVCVFVKAYLPVLVSVCVCVCLKETRRAHLCVAVVGVEHMGTGRPMRLSFNRWWPGTGGWEAGNSAHALPWNCLFRRPSCTC